MRSQQPVRWLSMMALFLASAGCCCVQGMPGDCGSCGVGHMAGRSCAGGCGEVYVDEWISQPPTVDQCCAGDCRPVRSLLAALWGSRFVQGCDMCGGGGCDDGCAGTCGYASAGGSGCTSCGGHIGMRDSEAAYTGMIDQLVCDVTDAFRTHYVTRTVPKEQLETATASAAGD